MLLLTVTLLFTLGLSAISAAAEAAIFSLGAPGVRVLVDEGRRGSEALARLRERPGRLVVLLRLARTLALVATVTLAGALGYRNGGAGGLSIGIVAAALAILLAEVIPLRMTMERRARLALAVAPILRLLSRPLAPLLGVLGPGRSDPERAAGAGERADESELESLAVLGQPDATLGAHERQLIERAFRVDEIKAWDVMTPRVDIFAWRDSLRLAEIAPELGAVPYSRVPVYGESIDDVTGVLYLRDAYQALVMGQRDVPLRALAREPLIVPGSVPVMELLRDFQARRIHLALVLDEYGGTDGLVTLEDVIEELVGEIEDETDVAEEPILRVSRHEIIAAGDADLREVNHLLNASLPQLEHRSLNGFVLEELGHVPEPGESLEREGIAIEVLEATEMQVLRARLRRILPPAEPGARPAPAPSASDAAQRPAAHGGEDGEASPAEPEIGAAEARSGARRSVRIRA